MQNAQGTGLGSPPGPSSGGAGEVKHQVGSLVSDAKEQASRLIEDAKSQARGAVDQRKGTAVETLGSVAGALRQAGRKLEDDQVAGLGTYAAGAADQVDRVARYLREKDVQGLTRDAETFARRHPEVFLGGAFLAGIFAARFLKSSRSRTGDGGRGFGYEGIGNEGYRSGFGAEYGAASGYESGAPGYIPGASPAATGEYTTEPLNPPPGSDRTRTE